MVAQVVRLPVEGGVALFAQRAVEEPRLAEPASADAPAQHLDHRAVVHRLGEGHDEILRVVDAVEIPDDPLQDPGGRTLPRGDGFDRAVLPVADVVEGGDVDAPDPRGAAQEGLLVPASRLAIL